MIGNFPVSLSHVLAVEEGYVNNPHDKGGPTNKGITQHNYDLWRIAHQQPTRSVQFIDPNEVEAIYAVWYWSPIHGDQLPAGVDYCVFDAAVNSGPHTAVEWLQRAVDVVADGQVGPQTLAAVGKTDPKELIREICLERLDYDQTLSGWPFFGRGWSSRIAEVQCDAQGMA